MFLQYQFIQNTIKKLIILYFGQIKSLFKIPFQKILFVFQDI